MASSSILTVAWRRYLQQLDHRPLRTKARQPMGWGGRAWLAAETRKCLALCWHQLPAALRWHVFPPNKDTSLLLLPPPLMIAGPDRRRAGCAVRSAGPAAGGCPTHTRQLAPHAGNRAVRLCLGGPICALLAAVPCSSAAQPQARQQRDVSAYQPVWVVCDSGGCCGGLLSHVRCVLHAGRVFNARMVRQVPTTAALCCAAGPSGCCWTS